MDFPNNKVKKKDSSGSQSMSLLRVYARAVLRYMGLTYGN